jgi:diguanylate cyclase (GGDEF)-like protein
VARRLRGWLGAQLKRAEVRLAVLILAIAVAAAAAWSGVWDYPTLASLPSILWPALAAGFVAAEFGVVRIELGRHTYDISLSELPLVLGLLFTSPLALLLARSSASAVVEAIRRRPLSKRSFNVALELLETALAVAVFRAVLGQHDVLGLAGWLAALLAVLVTTLVSVIGVTLAIGSTEGRLQPLPLPELGVAGITQLASTCLAVLAAVVFRADPVDTWLLVVPAMLVLLAHWAYMTTRRRHTRLHAIYEYTREVGTTLEAEPRIRAILEGARQMLRSERAELIFLGDRDAGGIRIGVGPGEELQRGPADEAYTRLGRHVLDRGSTVKLPDAAAKAVSQRMAAEAAQGEALAIAVRGPDGPMAVLVVAERLGDAQGFDADDAELLEALANVAGVAMHNDRLIGELHRLVNELRQETLERAYQASHDSLTGLASRRVFDERASAALAAGGMVAVMLIDLDRFKDVNDTLGHHAGDRLLGEAARRLKSALRTSASAARLGGDEFAVVLPEVASEAAALEEARSVCSILDGPYHLDGLTIDMGASAGLAVAPEHGTSVDLLLQRADMAMYEAKAEERGVVLYTLGRDRDNLRRLTMVGELRADLEAGRLDVVYQPILRLSQSEVFGIEALVRWSHPVYGEVSPDEFVPLAEQAGLIRQLTDFVLARALRESRAWEVSGFALPLHVNLSVRSLRDPQLMGAVSAELEGAGVSPGTLVFEVTEGGIMDDPRRALDTMSKLRALGVRLAIDDFGAGRSSLGYLQRLPVDLLKIDQTFVFGLAGQRVNDAIVRLIVDLSQALGLQVVAEGVEDEATWDRLRAMGCEAGQGYFLARPMPAESMMLWLAARHDPPTDIAPTTTGNGSQRLAVH